MVSPAQPLSVSVPKPVPFPACAPGQLCIADMEMRSSAHHGGKGGIQDDADLGAWETSRDLLLTPYN